MPVVNFSYKRIEKLIPEKKVQEVIEALPFIGLDIEGTDNVAIRLEYNPNRPDFSSDYGIARAIRGLLGLEEGVPKFKVGGASGKQIIVDNKVRNTRPYIMSFIARNGKMDDETLKQLISMQEDLHNGIGRRRKKASIGIHNMDAIDFPVRYTAIEDSLLSFVALGQNKKQNIRQILDESEYSNLLHGINRYPLIIDKNNDVISFPPIINSEKTRVTPNTKNLFIEITATSHRTAEDMLSILAMTMYDAGFEIESVAINPEARESIGGNDKKFGDNMHSRKSALIMEPRYVSVDKDYINSILGLQLDTTDIINCLKKARLDARIEDRSTNAIICTIPRYRTDIIHPVDIAEEVAIGYGIFNIQHTMPASIGSGARSRDSIIFDAIRNTLIGLGMLEVVNFSLSSKRIQYEMTARPQPDKILMVQEGRSSEHELLRDSLIPLLLQSLSANIHEPYPQNIFEIGKTFSYSEVPQESWYVAAAMADKSTNFTVAKSNLQALVRYGLGKDIVTVPVFDPLFIDGRCAQVYIERKNVGIIGEISPRVMENFRIRVPVAAFEINIDRLKTR
jgi:phenylalanyl-tRNA synthetase beta chain